jgi:hypothetical protein
MQSVFARVLLGLAVAVIVAIVLFYIGVALIYVAIVGGGIAIAALILAALGRGVAGGRLPDRGDV